MALGNLFLLLKNEIDYIVVAHISMHNSKDKYR